MSHGFAGGGSRRFNHFHAELAARPDSILLRKIWRGVWDGARVAAGDVLGKATGESVFVVIRSKIFDSYLVSMAQVMPYRHHECWYFYPGMLDAAAMDWLSYAPFGKCRAEWHYLKITRFQKERDFQYKTLVYTSLLEYPVAAADGTSRQSLVRDYSMVSPDEIVVGYIRDIQSQL